MTRRIMGGMMAAGAALSLAVGACVAVGGELPVGYDHPESDQGGPALKDGLAAMSELGPNPWRPLELAPRLKDGPLTVMFLTNFNGLPAVFELNRRFPVDALTVHTPGSAGNAFGGRARFNSLLNSRKRVDVFVLSRVAENSIPADVQYEMLRRVKEDGAGLVVVDLFDRSDSFNQNFLMLKPSAKGPEIIPGVPYAGLESVDASTTPAFSGADAPRKPLSIKPFKYGDTTISPFGKGTVVWISTNTHWERHWGGMPFVPFLTLGRAQAVLPDYFNSHTAKAIMIASGRIMAARIEGVTAGGVESVGSVSSVRLTTPAGRAFTGKLRWQIRDMWGKVWDTGEQPLSVPAGGATVNVDGARFVNAGRQFLDVWVETNAGETVDWGSAFADIKRGTCAIEIRAKHPQGTPRGAPLEGYIVVKDAPQGAAARVTLIDRHWREMGVTELPASGEGAFSFPSTGLDGAIWRAQADVFGKDGAILARAHLNLTMPYDESRTGWWPLVTGEGEYLRRIGFLVERAYGVPSPAKAEAENWTDIQPMPFPQPPKYRFAGNVWQDPACREICSKEVSQFVTELLPYGIRAINLTDDSGPSYELSGGAYQTVEFHEFLKREYGDFDSLRKAWSWNTDGVAVKEGELPFDPYATLRFHQWLLKKHGDVAGIGKAWKIAPDKFKEGFNFLGTLHHDSLEAMRKAGDTEPFEDLKLFLAEDAAAKPAANSFGTVNAAAIRKAHDAGNNAPWIDAKRFLMRAWVDDMVRVKTWATKIKPGISVGTDAAYYGPTLADAFGRLDYLAPYYNDRSVKVAVSRGRMRRPGIYGACLGSYGDKPANMCGRRSQIWDVLFAGGNGFYYWYFGCGFQNDRTLSDAHAKYQCEVIEELSRGIGELFTGCQRVFEKVAILDSQASILCDEVEKACEPITSQGNSIAAFQFAMEDLCLNPHTITSDELADGWLEKNGTKLLLLPGVNSLSDQEAAVIRKFVENGGTVAADSRPGGRMPNSNLRDKPALDDVFGVTTNLEVKERRTRGALSGTFGMGAAVLSFGEALIDPRVKATTAVTSARTDKAAALFENKFGKGRAFLFNASFSSYSTLRVEGGVEWGSWFTVVKGVAAAAGLERQFIVTSEGKETAGLEVSPFLNGDGYLLGVEDLAAGDYVGRRRPFELRLPGAFHVYDARSSEYLGQLSSLKADIPRGGHRVYSLMPYKIKGLDVKVDKAQNGKSITVAVNLKTDGGIKRGLHVVRIEATDPDGKPFFPFYRVLRMPADGPLVAPLALASNDPKGAWEFTVTDVNSGETETVKLGGTSWLGIF